LQRLQRLLTCCQKSSLADRGVDSISSSVDNLPRRINASAASGPSFVSIPIIQTSRPPACMAFAYSGVQNGLASLTQERVLAAFDFSLLIIVITLRIIISEVEHVEEVANRRHVVGDVGVVSIGYGIW